MTAFEKKNAQKNVEIILLRQIISAINIPAFIADPQQTIIFYNQSCENILGIKFSEMGEMRFDDWFSIYQLEDLEGRLIHFKESSFYHCYHTQQLSQNTCYLKGLNKNTQKINTSSIPIIHFTGKFLGVITYFQETSQ